MEESIADFEGKLGLKDDKHVILDHIANKLQVYDAEFCKHHYGLVNCINDAVEFEAQGRIFDDHDRWMMDLFRQMTNLQPCERIVRPPPKPVDETIYLMLIIPVYSC